LSLIWSKGPAHTAEIFKDIKKQKILGGFSTTDPDLQKISKIGTIGEAEEDMQQ
jgi:hypothetical protein